MQMIYCQILRNNNTDRTRQSISSRQNNI